MENKVTPLTRSAVYSAKLTVSVELGTTLKTVREVFAMGVGTIIELDKLAGEPVDVKANGIPVARAEVVVIDEIFGVRICEIIGEPGTSEDPKLSGQPEPESAAPEPTAGEST